MSEDKKSTRQCPAKNCDFVNSSGNEGDLNYHLSTAHPELWKKQNEEVNKAATKHMKEKFGKDYIRKTAQKESKRR